LKAKGDIAESLAVVGLVPPIVFVFYLDLTAESLRLLTELFLCKP